MLDANEYLRLPNTSPARHVTQSSLKTEETHLSSWNCSSTFGGKIQDAGGTNKEYTYFRAPCSGGMVLSVGD